MSRYYKSLTFLMLAIALLPLSAIAILPKDITSNASTIPNPKSKIDSRTTHHVPRTTSTETIAN